MNTAMIVFLCVLAFAGLCFGGVIWLKHHANVSKGIKNLESTVKDAGKEIRRGF